jgi:hypothetical protein
VLVSDFAQNAERVPQSRRLAPQLGLDLGIELIHCRVEGRLQIPALCGQKKARTPAKRLTNRSPEVCLTIPEEVFQIAERLDCFKLQELPHR